MIVTNLTQVTRHKVNVEKLLLPLHSNNEQIQNKIQKNIKNYTKVINPMESMSQKILNLHTEKSKIKWR